MSDESFFENKKAYLFSSKKEEKIHEVTMVKQ